MLRRRGFISGLGLLAVPAIIRTPGLLMPVKPQRALPPPWFGPGPLFVTIHGLDARWRACSETVTIREDGAVRGFLAFRSVSSYTWHTHAGGGGGGVA